MVTQKVQTENIIFVENLLLQLFRVTVANLEYTSKIGIWIIMLTSFVLFFLQKNKKISELEEKLHNVAPEEASLLLNEELRPDNDTMNSMNLSVYSRGNVT